MEHHLTCSPRTAYLIPAIAHLSTGHRVGGHMVVPASGCAPARLLWAYATSVPDIAKQPHRTLHCSTGHRIARR
eukprot:3940502-Rhodomonas_salina.2